MDPEAVPLLIAAFVPHRLPLAAGTDQVVKLTCLSLHGGLD
jgi:hypothetical protein